MPKQYEVYFGARAVVSSKEIKKARGKAGRQEPYENQKLEMPWLLTSASSLMPALHIGHSREE